MPLIRLAGRAAWNLMTASTVLATVRRTTGVNVVHWERFSNPQVRQAVQAFQGIGEFVADGVVKAMPPADPAIKSLGEQLRRYRDTSAVVAWYNKRVCGGGGACCVPDAAAKSPADVHAELLRTQERLDELRALLATTPAKGKDAPAAAAAPAATPAATEESSKN